MLDAINAFEIGQSSLAGLIGNLEALLNMIENVESSWRDTFLQYWGILEDGRAVVLFRNSGLDEQETRSAHQALARLKLMVLDKIEDPADRAQDIDWSKS